MKRIAICDDEASVLHDLQNFLREYEKSSGMQLKLLPFLSAEQLMQSAPIYDLIILDIQLAGLNGMEAAKMLRKAGVSCPILFLTALKDYVFEAFDVDAVNYLLKPIDKRKLFCSVEKSLVEGHSELLVKQGYDYRKIDAADILYCEAVGRKVSVHNTQRETIEYYQKFSELPGLLGKAFYAPHRSFLINLDHLAAIDGNDAVMDNGDRVPIAKGKKEKLVQRLLEHFQEKRV